MPGAGKNIYRYTFMFRDMGIAVWLGKDVAARARAFRAVDRRFAVAGFQPPKESRPLLENNSRWAGWTKRALGMTIHVNDWRSTAEAGSWVGSATLHRNLRGGMVVLGALSAQAGQRTA